MRLEVKLLPVQKALYKSEKQIAGIYSARGVGKSYVLSFLIAIAAGVAAHYICKWLDGK